MAFQKVGKLPTQDRNLMRAAEQGQHKHPIAEYPALLWPMWSIRHEPGTPADCPVDDVTRELSPGQTVGLRCGRLSWLA